MKQPIPPRRTSDQRFTRLAAERAQWLAFLRRRVGREVDAEDLLQVGLTRAFHHVGEVRSDEDLIAWFYRLLRHAVVDYYRKRTAEHRRTERLHSDMQAVGEDFAHPDADEMLALCACIIPRIKTLNPRYAELIQAIDLKGRSPAEVAKEQGATLNTINVALHRARQALRSELERFCGECAKGACLDCGCEPGEKHG